MTIRNELIDKLPSGQDPASAMRQDGLLGELKQYDDRPGLPKNSPFSHYHTIDL